MAVREIPDTDGEQYLAVPTGTVTQARGGNAATFYPEVNVAVGGNSLFVFKLPASAE